MANDEFIRILRVLEYVGPRSQVEMTLASSIHGERHQGPMVIKATTVGVNPEHVPTAITPALLKYVTPELHYLLNGPLLSALKLAADSNVHVVAGRDHRSINDPNADQQCATCQAQFALQLVDKLYGLEADKNTPEQEDR